MGDNKKILESANIGTVLILIASIVIVLVIVGNRISDGVMNKSRLSVAMQTVKSAATALSGCQVGNLKVSAPDSAKTPQNSPCSEAGKYATLNANSTANCLYNTNFVPTISENVVANGAIQAGCNCAGTTIGTCKNIFQCDFATTGKCSENIAIN